MPDYRELYLTLMREVEKSVKLLINAQQKCEDMYIDAEEPLLQMIDRAPNSPNEKTADEMKKL